MANASGADYWWTIAPWADAYAAGVTPYNKVVLLVGSAAILACLTIAAVFVLTEASAAQLQADRAAARTMQALGDDLMIEVREQQDALDDYILAGDPTALARYRQAVMDEAGAAAEISAVSAGLAGVADALAGVDAENDNWRATIAGPAIAALQSGSHTAVTEAIQIRIKDQETSQFVSSELLVQIDSAGADLDARSDALNRFRVQATGLGVAVELIAACLSLWFVRRYGQSVARDARRRASASAERIEIMASLRKLQTHESPEATAAVIAEALHCLPGVDVACVFECTSEATIALAIVGLAGFPTQSGDALSRQDGRYLQDRTNDGPWAERWVLPPEPTADFTAMAALGLKSWAMAPVHVKGELVAMIGVITTDEDQAAHMVEDLPAVSEFASVAQAILAPALVARRQRTVSRQRITALIEANAFRPVFQPVVELATGRTVGFEALTRFNDGSPPDLAFAAAVECGMGIRLELATLEVALQDARRLPPDTWLSLNVSPDLLGKGGGTLAGMLSVRTCPVVLEVTEHDAIDAYGPLREAMARLGPDVTLAVDDAGAGVANFNHLVELRPDFLKIDVGLVRGVDLDPGRQAVVAGLVHFAGRTGCQVIAEGIETEAERAMVTQLGVTLGQGYLLARPAPVETWSIDTTHVGLSKLRFRQVAPLSKSFGASRLPQLGSLPPITH
ncbi:MAG: hypothetical protein QOJ75_854 [Chloroflexota bacterium]|nr:hypothetical protein [Chloroflexota bacterium]